LARHFLLKSAQELGVEPKRISDEAMRFISQQPFPGNVRQLENLCHWLTVLAPAQVVRSKICRWKCAAASRSPGSGRA